LWKLIEAKSLGECTFYHFAGNLLPVSNTVPCLQGDAELNAAVSTMNHPAASRYLGVVASLVLGSGVLAHGENSSRNTAKPGAKPEAAPARSNLPSIGESPNTLPKAVAAEAAGPGAATGSIRLKHAELRTALLAAKPVPGIAGSAVPVKLIADAGPIRSGVPAGVAFKSGATAEAQAALKAVADFLNVRHHGLPVGQKVEVTIAGDAAPADFGSSSFAAAVAIDAMLAGGRPSPRSQ
jgi:hypothetical protein